MLNSKGKGRNIGRRIEEGRRRGSGKEASSVQSTNYLLHAANWLGAALGHSPITRYKGGGGGGGDTYCRGCTLASHV